MVESRRWSVGGDKLRTRLYSLPGNYGLCKYSGPTSSHTAGDAIAAIAPPARIYWNFLSCTRWGGKRTSVREKKESWPSVETLARL